MNEKQRKDIEKIKELFRDDIRVELPAFPGEVHDIYIVTTSSGKLVFRFSDQKTALKNAHTSRILRQYGIPIPDVASYRIDVRKNLYIETYPFIEGKTLYERNLAGISQEKIKDIYKQLYEICIKMAKIPVKEIRYSHDKTEFDFQTKKKDLFFSAMNMAPLVVGHDDLHDKNILLDENDNICAILDLDAIKLKPLVIFLMKMADEWRKYGFDTDSIKELSPDLYHNGKLPNLKNQIKIYETLRDVFHGRFSQLLKKRNK